MKAFLKNYRQSPRKVRLVAGLVKGKNVAEALPMLDLLAKRAGFPLKKLLISAVANANGIDKENLYIKELRVDKGIVMKRMMPAAMGSAHRINKRTSNITLLLAEKERLTLKKDKIEEKKGGKKMKKGSETKNRKNKPKK